MLSVIELAVSSTAEMKVYWFAADLTVLMLLQYLASMLASANVL
ncbi:hypothetical protein ACHAXH_007317 [Discostella pseudostelligera]